MYTTRESLQSIYTPVYVYEVLLRETIKQSLFRELLLYPRTTTVRSCLVRGTVELLKAFWTHLGFLSDESGHELLACIIVLNDHLDPVAAKEILAASEVGVLADDDARDAIQQDRACAHATRAALVLRACKPLAVACALSP